MGQTRSRRREKKDKKNILSHENDLNADFIPLDPIEEPDDDISSLEPVRDNRASFFGLLDRSELEYFKNAESMLATNSLNLEEREAFVNSVFLEAKGKELKLATNQVCSKLFERLVKLANEENVQQLMAAVEPFAVDLAYQKFSSHCLEAIFTKAIPIASCESLVASCANNLGSSGIALAHDKYGAHVLSTVILSLSGLNENLRSKKSQLARKHTEIEEEKGQFLEISAIPDNLRAVCRSIVHKIAKSLDKVEARNLSINSVSSPTMQALVMAEASLMSSYKLVEMIVLSEDSAGFISHCCTDNVGSHFLDAVVKTLPAKKMGKLLNALPLEKMSASENEASAYLVQSVISHSNLSNHHKKEIIRNSLKDLIGVNVGISVAALDVDFELVAPLIMQSFELKKLDLCDTRCSALFEKMSKYDPFLEKAVDTIALLDDKTLEKMGTDATQSYVLQSLLRVSAPVITRRKLLNKLVIHIPTYSVNAFGSHIVDSLWSASYKLKFARERIASELLKLEEQVKHSPYGRKVWKNWHMEKYSRKRHEWWQTVKSEEDALREQLEGTTRDEFVARSQQPPSKKRKNHSGK